jgi:hypothetical protein
VPCQHIARWDGNAWEPLGAGVSCGQLYVNALAVYNGELIAGGGFATAGGHVSAYFARWACERCIGDLNCDGFIDFGDINPFVLCLSNFDGWQTTFPGCPPENGDINGDGTYGQESLGDINPFVPLLIGGQGACP